MSTDVTFGYNNKLLGETGCSVGRAVAGAPAMRNGGGEWQAATSTKRTLHCVGVGEYNILYDIVIIVVFSVRCLM